MPEETTTDPQGQSTQPTVPSTSQEGQTTKTEIIQEELPEQFKGKSATEIAKSYVELQKLQGKHTQEVQQTREQLGQWEALGKIIQGNPALYKQIEDEIGKLSGNQQTNGQVKVDDTRGATQVLIVNNFEKDYGIDNLPKERKEDLQRKIGLEVRDMTGKNVNELPVDLLPKYLEKAYKLVTREDDKERVRAEALIQARQNSEASFDSMRSSGVKSQGRSLTPEQQKVARRLHIKEEDYIKQVEEIEKERTI